MYYIRHKQTGLYFAGMRFENPYWRKKPRVYTTKGAAKLSMVPFLVNAQWSLVPMEEKRRLIDQAKESYRIKYPKMKSWANDDFWAERRAKNNYWNTAKNQSLEDLLPPDIELKELAYE